MVSWLAESESTGKDAKNDDVYYVSMDEVLNEVMGINKVEESQGHVHRVYFMGPNTFSELCLRSFSSRALYQRIKILNVVAFGGDGSYMVPFSLHNDNIFSAPVRNSRTNAIFKVGLIRTDNGACGKQIKKICHVTCMHVCRVCVHRRRAKEDDLVILSKYNIFCYFK